MPKPQPASPTRIARLVACCVLWLLHHAWALLDGGPQSRRQLKKATKAAAALVYFRASELAGPPQVQKQRRPAHPRSTPRGFARRIGTRNLRVDLAPIRRRLRKSKPGVRLCVLLNTFLNPDTLAVEFATWLKRPTTRLAPIVPVRPPADALTSRAFAPVMAGADTS